MDTVSKRYKENVAILDIRGAVGYKNRAKFGEALFEAVASRDGVIVNFDDMTQIDGISLGVLLGASFVANQRGIKLVLLNVQDDAAQRLGLARLNDDFERYDYEDEALESCKKK